MKKEFVLGIIVGLIVSSSVVIADNYLYKAEEVSYTPKDNSWNVDNVNDAIFQLYNKTSSTMPIPTATKTITSNGNNIDVLNYAKINVDIQTGATYLGTGQSFDVKSLRSDYASLTSSDFAVEPVNHTKQNIVGGEWSGERSVFSITKSYDSSTGVLNAYATNSVDFRGMNGYFGYNASSSKYDVKAYVIK